MTGKSAGAGDRTELDDLIDMLEVAMRRRVIESGSEPDLITALIDLCLYEAEREQRPDIAARVRALRCAHFTCFPNTTVAKDGAPLHRERRKSDARSGVGDQKKDSA